MKNKTAIDMTHGPLLSKILLFSLPLMASNILQLLFNAADVAVIGRFAGHTSLAAVGSTTSVVFLFLNLLIGMSVGVNVLIARYIGLGNHEKEIGLSLHTAMTVALFGGALLGGIGILASEWVLRMMSTPEDVLPLAVIYIRIYFAGTPFAALYNYGAAALRATGDTRRPLVFLTASGIANVVLNLFFVVPLRMDVAGVALATILSQALSAALVMRCLMQANDELHFSWRKLCLDKRSLLDMARIGIPAGVNSTLFSLANVVLQGAINSYDSIIMAACSAAFSIENFQYTAMNSFHHACQTFCSQNLGAGEHERIGRVVRACIICVTVVGVGIGIVFIVFAEPLMRIYNTDPAVVAAGVSRMQMMCSLYFIFGLTDVLVGALRGCGAAIIPVVINLLGTCVLRVAWISLLDTSAVGVGWVYFAFPLTWIVTLIALIPFWIRMRRQLGIGQNKGVLRRA
ncbi:MAG: MATE family efflux transporter [Butyricicoccus sp.]|nr:MATE family efflux transporter [Butyricicoccus sp.]